MMRGKRAKVLIDTPTMKGVAHGDSLENFLKMMDDPDDW
jgi:hypothetical protein